MKSSLILLCLALGCRPTGTFVAEPQDCVPELPDPTRSRVKRIACEAELGTGSDTRIGDWLLQSTQMTVIVRQATNALTRIGRAGGTLVEVTSADMAEVVPLLETTDGAGDWFVDATITAVRDETGAGLQVDGTLPDGTTGQLLWWLDHGDNRLQVLGTDTFVIAPMANTTVRGDMLQYGERLVGSGVLAEDTGGHVLWTNTHWFAAATAEQLPILLPERYVQPIVGSCVDGDVIYLLDDETRVVQRVDLDGGADFAFLADRRAREIACYATGRSSSGWQPLPDWEADDSYPEHIDLSVGDYGELSALITDRDGRLLPSVVWWNGRSNTLYQGRGTLYPGAGEGSGLATAGPAYSSTRLATLDVGEDSSTWAVLERVLPDDALLADFFVESWPHPTTRTSANTQIKRRLAAGVEWAVTVGDHVVSTVDVPSTSTRDLWGTTGARAPTAWGTITSWPWSANSRASGYGAPDTTDLDPHQALAVMGGGRGLTTVVDTTWLEHAGPPHTWPVVPDALHLQSLEELPTYFDLLDQWTGLALVGPRTWLDGVDRRTMSRADGERALLERRTMASTGPFIRLRVDGFAPGGTLLEETARVAKIEVHAPKWMPVDHVALLGPEGTVVEWRPGNALDVRRLQAEVALPRDLPWVVAVAWSDNTVPELQEAPPWAVTSAIFLQRP